MKLRGAIIAGAFAVCGLGAAQGSPADPLAPTARWSAYTGGNAHLPPMGWNSWNAFGSAIDEAKLMGSAEAIVKLGLAAKGYRYVDLDDGWWLKRRHPDGRIIIRTETFPSAVTADGNTSFRPLTDRLHAMGLKAGIYSDMGNNSCAQLYSTDGLNQPVGTLDEKEVGLHDNVDKDIKLYFAEWGFDLIKVDACGLRGLTPASAWVKDGKFRALPPIVDSESLGRTNIPATKALYNQVRSALEKYNPDNDFVYSLCLWGAANVRAWGKDMGNMSRTSDDIAPTWGRMLHSYDSAVRRALYAHPGSWNDPDMLYIGAGDFDENHLTEARSHFALWAMLNAPMMIGYDLRKAPPSLIDVFGNAAIIAVNQDPGGHQAVLAYDSNDVQFLVKTLSGGDKAVALFNRTNGALDVNLTADQLKFVSDADVELTDLWSGKTLRFRGEQGFKLAAHTTLIFRAKGTRRLAEGLYLSEMPGSVNPAVDGVAVPEPEPMIYRPIFWSGTRGMGEPPRYGGWGGAQADATPYGMRINVGGAPYETGLGVLSNSRLEVRNMGFRHFSAMVGVDDSAQSKARPVTFAVYGDGKLIARSKPMRFGQPPAPLTASVAGVTLIELVARSGDDAPQPFPVAWGEAALTR